MCSNTVKLDDTSLSRVSISEKKFSEIRAQKRSQLGASNEYFI